MSNRRYLAGVHLSLDTDPDLVRWAQELVTECRLSQVVRDGLRLMQYLCSMSARVRQSWGNFGHMAETER